MIWKVISRGDLIFMYNERQGAIVVKKLLLLFILCFAAPAALGDNDGARGLSLPPSEIFRLPQANGGGIAFEVKNIQVEARWTVLSDDVALTINDGVLTFPSTLSPQQAVATVIVEDNFRKLNSAYENLAATAIITIEFIASGTMFLTGGGAGGNSNSKGDTWSSTDGENWQIKNTLSFPPRRAHAMAAFNGRLYVMGGADVSGVPLGDIWSSADGAVWQPETESWSARSGHAVAVLRNTLFLSGGTTNDVWSTPDGTNWSLVNNNTGWGKRGNHQMVSHNGRLYVIGGYKPETGGVEGDVWSSLDGKNWTLELATDDSPFGKRIRHRVVAHNHRLYLMGGEKGDSLASLQKMNDVWSSANGKDWVPKTNMGGGPRISFGALSYNGRLYIMGGIGKRNVWSSVDGAEWRLEKNNPNWSNRENFAVSILPAK